MSKFDAVKNELEKGHKVFKAFELALETITALQNSEQVAKELADKRNKLSGEIVDVEKDLTILKAQLASLKEATKNEVSVAKDKAGKIVDEANKKASSMMSDADAYVKSCSDLAENSKSEVAASMAAVDKAKADLTDIEGKLAKAKQAAAKMLG